MADAEYVPTIVSCLYRIPYHSVSDMSECNRITFQSSFQVLVLILARSADRRGPHASFAVGREVYANGRTNTRGGHTGAISKIEVVLCLSSSLHKDEVEPWSEYLPVLHRRPKA